MIYELLPLLEGWGWLYNEDSGTLSLGTAKTLFTIKAPGYFVAASCHLSGSRDAKYVHIRVDMDREVRPFTIDFTPFGLYAFGSLLPIPFGAYVSKWDDENKYYTGSIVPNRPVPYKYSFEIRLIPPSKPQEEVEEKTIKYHAAYVIIYIHDISAFNRSLNKVMRGEL